MSSAKPNLVTTGEYLELERKSDIRSELVAGREAVGATTDWASVAGYCGLLAAFAIACLALATKAFGAYQKQV